MSNGFYLMHRGWMNHPVFENERFCERMAWEWLIHEAAFEPHITRFKSKIIEVRRGQVPTSFRKLQAQFGWGAGKVKAFLNILQSQRMIDANSERGFLIITICNYEKYQNPYEQSGTLDDTNSEREPHQKRNEHKEIERNKRNKKNNTKKISRPESVTQSVWESFLEHRKAKRSPVSEMVMKGIEREAAKAGWSLDAALAETCTRGWTSFKAEWVAGQKKSHNRRVL